MSKGAWDDLKQNPSSTTPPRILLAKDVPDNMTPENYESTYNFEKGVYYYLKRWPSEQEKKNSPPPLKRQPSTTVPACISTEANNYDSDESDSTLLQDYFRRHAGVYNSERQLGNGRHPATNNAFMVQNPFHLGGIQMVHQRPPMATTMPMEISFPLYNGKTRPKMKFKLKAPPPPPPATGAAPVWDSLELEEKSVESDKKISPTKRTEAAPALGSVSFSYNFDRDKGCAANLSSPSSTLSGNDSPMPMNDDDDGSIVDSDKGEAANLSSPGSTLSDRPMTMNYNGNGYVSDNQLADDLNTNRLNKINSLKLKRRPLKRSILRMEEQMDEVQGENLEANIKALRSKWELLVDSIIQLEKLVGAGRAVNWTAYQKKNCIEAELAGMIATAWTPEFDKQTATLMIDYHNRLATNKNPGIQDDSYFKRFQLSAVEDEDWVLVPYAILKMEKISNDHWRVEYVCCISLEDDADVIWKTKIGRYTSLLIKKLFSTRAHDMLLKAAKAKGTGWINITTYSAYHRFFVNHLVFDHVRRRPDGFILGRSAKKFTTVLPENFLAQAERADTARKRQPLPVSIQREVDDNFTMQLPYWVQVQCGSKGSTDDICNGSATDNSNDRATTTDTSNDSATTTDNSNEANIGNSRPLMGSTNDKSTSSSLPETAFCGPDKCLERSIGNALSCINRTRGIRANKVVAALVKQRQIQRYRERCFSVMKKKCEHEAVECDATFDPLNYECHYPVIAKLKTQTCLHVVVFHNGVIYDPDLPRAVKIGKVELDAICGGEGMYEGIDWAFKIQRFKKQKKKKK